MFANRPILAWRFVSLGGTSHRGVLGLGRKYRLHTLNGLFLQIRYRRRKYDVPERPPVSAEVMPVIVGRHCATFTLGTFRRTVPCAVQTATLHFETMKVMHLGSAVAEFIRLTWPGAGTPNHIGLFLSVKHEEAAFHC